MWSRRRVWEQQYLMVVWAILIGCTWMVRVMGQMASIYRSTTRRFGPMYQSSGCGAKTKQLVRRPNHQGCQQSSMLYQWTAMHVYPALSQCSCQQHHNRICPSNSYGLQTPTQHPSTITIPITIRIIYLSIMQLHCSRLCYRRQPRCNYSWSTCAIHNTWIAPTTTSSSTYPLGIASYTSITTCTSHTSTLPLHSAPSTTY